MVMTRMGLRPEVPRRFLDRREAGRLLAARLQSYAGDDVVVLGLPRGGVPVAYEVAVALAAPLDVFMVRKLGAPGQEELAMGALASGGANILNREVIAALHVSRDELRAVADREFRELARREHLYRDSRPYPALECKTVILVDDGLATGASMLVAAGALRRSHPAKLVVAVPVAPPEAGAQLRECADEVICFETPERFGGVGEWYEDFSQVSDDEVRALLNAAALRRLP